MAKRLVGTAMAVFLLATQAVAAPLDLRQRGLGALAFIDAHFKLLTSLYADHWSPAQNKPPGNSSAWASGVMLSALNAAAELDPARIAAAHHYAVALDAYRFQPAGQPIGYQPFPGNKPDELFYDDNAWLALAFLETYELSKDAADLKRSEDAFAYVASGESPDLGGGIFWSSKKHEKNTCVNAPAICAALRLYKTTNEQRYLDTAKRLYVWMLKLQDADGLYFDHLNLDDTIDKTKWSYNSALMLRANVLFYRQSNEQKYLDEANRIADAAEAKWFTAEGKLADDAAFAHLLSECLLELNEIAPRPATVAHVTKALNNLAALSHANAYPKRWDGWKAGETKIELLPEASAARAFLYASKYATVPATRAAK